MSFKIIQPTTNPDRIGRGGAIVPGTPDQKIEFPTGEGTIALTSQIPQVTFYPLVNTYKNTTQPQILTEWDLPIIAGKFYELQYSLYMECSESNRSYYGGMYYTGSQIYVIGGVANDNNYFQYSVQQFNTTTRLDSETYALYPVKPDQYTSYTGSNGYVYTTYMTVTIKAEENGTLRHVFQDSNASQYVTGSLLPSRTFMKITQLN